MKNIILASIGLLLSAVTFPQEHHGPPKPPPPAQRWQRDSAKIVKVMALNKVAGQKLRAIFLDFYTGMDKLHKNNKGVRPPAKAVQALIAKRNVAVKKILTAGQWLQFQSVEKQLGPPPPPRPPR